jgi:uncharacterized protein (TIGR03084 family)
MLSEAGDYRDECDALHALLASLRDDVFASSTLFKGWTIDDVLGHLYEGDCGAVAALDGDEAYSAHRAPWLEAQARGVSLIAYTAQFAAGLKGQALLRCWYECTREVARRYADAAEQRVPWGTVRMSARSCISSRLMETWAHGQEVYDRLGKVRVETDRVKGIAFLGVNTFGFTFTNRALEAPAEKPFVRLVAPSGAIWTWNSPDAQSSVEGSAVEFCQVVAQTRNVADTKLTVRGDAATRWMAIAQCFQGAAQDPPTPGARRLHSRGES